MSVIIRTATEDDYQGILDIGDVYNGPDYIPFMLRKYLTDDRHYCYVAEVDSTIVSIINHHEKGFV